MHRVLELRCALVAYLRNLLLTPGGGFVLPCAARDTDSDARHALTLLLLRDGLQQAVEDLWGALEGEPRGGDMSDGGSQLPLLVFLVENLLSLLFLSLRRHHEGGGGSDRVRWCTELVY